MKRLRKEIRGILDKNFITVVNEDGRYNVMESKLAKSDATEGLVDLFTTIIFTTKFKRRKDK